MTATVTPVQKILAAARWVLMASFASAVTCVYAWNVVPDAIDRFGARVVERYTADADRKLAHARSAAADRGVDGLSAAVAFATELSTIQKMDRLDGHKKDTLDVIVRTYAGAGDSPAALRWVEHWLAFDDRDLDAWLWKARVLSHVAGREEEGSQLLESLYRRLPEVSSIAHEYFAMLCGRGRFVDALEVVDHHMSRQYGSRDACWRVYWDLGHGFSEAQSRKITPVAAPDGTRSFVFQIAGDPRRIRFDPPPSSRLMIAVPEIRLPGRTIALGHADLVTNDVSRDGNTWITGGGTDPFLDWEVPAGQRTAGEIVFAAKLSVAPPPWARPLVTGGRSTELRESIGTASLALARRLTELEAHFASQRQDTPRSGDATE